MKPQLPGTAKWLKLGRLLLVFPAVGLVAMLLVVMLYNNPGDWHGIGRAVYGFGAFTVFSLIGGIVGALACFRVSSVAGVIALLIAVVTLMLYAYVLSQ